MSLPSYEISKTGGVWFCSGKMPTGKPFRFECGHGSRETARGTAEAKLASKVRSSEGSQKRWARWREAKARGETIGARIGRPPKSATVDAAPSAGPAPASSSSSSGPATSADEMRAKLIGLGDAQPIDPDEVIPPAGDGGAAARDEDPPMDDEGGELIASILAKGATVGLVAMTNARLAKRKPPQRAEPHEKGLEWFHDGLEFHLKKLLGKTATLGPTAKIFAGAAIIVGSMYMNAEPIDPPPAGASASPAPPPSPAAETPPPAPAPPEQTNGTSLMHQRNALGVFGLPRTAAN